MEIYSVPYVRIEDLFAEYDDMLADFKNYFYADPVGDRLATENDMFIDTSAILEWLEYYTSPQANAITERINSVVHCLVRWQFNKFFEGS